MERKFNLFVKIFISFTLFFWLLFLPLQAVEQGKTGKITSFDELGKGIAKAEKAVQKDPEEAEVHCRLAKLLLMKGQYEDAEQSFQKALSISPDHIESLLALSNMYRRWYQFEKGEKTLERVKALSPDEEKIQFLQARFAIDKMDFEAAETIYRGLLQKEPESACAICGLAEVYYWINQYKESEKFINQCLSVNPEMSKAYLVKSLIHRIRQQNDKWGEAGRKAVELDPFDDDARVNLSNILMRGEGKMQEGYEQTKIALKINPFSYMAHLYLGKGWTPKDYKKQEIEGDEETVKRIKELLKEGDEYLLNRDFIKADSTFNQVLELNSSNFRALIGKGTLNYQQDKYEAALSWFFKVLDADSDYGLAHYGVSQSLLRIKDRVNARFKEIERKFATKDTPEPPGLRDVLVNYDRLDLDLQKILRFAVKPLNKYLKALKIAGGTFYIMPFHKFLWESPRLARMKGQRTFDLRLWDDIKGIGGFHAASGANYEKGVKYLRFNVVAHEFAHQVHPFLGRKLRKEIKRLFLKAKKERLTLDFYADFNEWEYFAVGVEAYVSEEKLADQKIGYGHTRKELREKDSDLYHFIESLSQQESYVESEILAAIRKGWSSRRKDGIDKAFEIFEEAVDQYGRHPELLEAIAEVYSLKKDYGSAKYIYKQIIQEFPGDVIGYIGLAENYFFIDRDAAKAIQLLVKSTRAHPNAVELFVKLGQLCYYAADIDKLEGSLRHALSLDPFPDPYSLSNPYYYLAKGLIEKEDFAEAEKLLNFSLMELDKNDPQVRAELAFIFLKTGREKKGQEQLDIALKLRMLPRVQEVKAMFLAKQERLNETQALLEKLVKRFPRRIETKILLARLVMESAPERARQLLDEGFKIASLKEPALNQEVVGQISVSRLHTAYGNLLEKGGEIKGALNQHRKALDLFKYNHDSASSLERLKKK